MSIVTLGRGRTDDQNAAAPRGLAAPPDVGEVDTLVIATVRPEVAAPGTPNMAVVSPYAQAPSAPGTWPPPSGWQPADPQTTGWSAPGWPPPNWTQQPGWQPAPWSPAGWMPMQAAPARRARAPLALRLFVVLLLVVLCGSVVGVTTLHFDAKLMHRLQGYLHRQPAVATASVTHHAASPTAFRLLSSSATSASYTVPASQYSISLAITHPAWVVVKSPLGATKPLIAATLLPQGAATPIDITGTASLVFAARVDSITIRSGQKVIGVIHSPILGVTYTFHSDRS